MGSSRKPIQLGLAPGAENRQAALRSIARIDATLRRDRQSAQRERWLDAVEQQLQRGAAVVTKLLSEPGLSVADRQLGSRIGEALMHVDEQRQRVAIGRALHTAGLGNIWPKRAASSQPVQFRDGDATVIATARAAVRRDPNPKRTEPG